MRKWFRAGILSCMIMSAVFCTLPMGAAAATADSQTVTSGEVKTEKASSKNTVKVTKLKTTTKVLLMKEKTSYTPKITADPSGVDMSSMTAVSENPRVAAVDKKGRITAKKDGNTWITYKLGDKKLKIYVNVLTKVSDQTKPKIKLYNQSGKLLTYRMYRQKSNLYGKYTKYVNLHGCAVISMTTVVNAFSKKYASYHPGKIITSLEKSSVSGAEWKLNHVTRNVRNQMPLTLSGITRALRKAGIKAKYVRSFSSDAAVQKQIYAHLKTGNPVIFTARNYNRKAGRTDTKWTTYLHTMVFLGRYTTGEVLIADSADRTWYKGNQRLKVVKMSSILPHLFSCTAPGTGSYYTGTGTAGGYILVN